MQFSLLYPKLVKLKCEFPQFISNCRKHVNTNTSIDVEGLGSLNFEATGKVLEQKVGVITRPGLNSQSYPLINKQTCYGTSCIPLLLQGSSRKYNIAKYNYTYLYPILAYI